MIYRKVVILMAKRSAHGRTTVLEFTFIRNDVEQRKIKGISEDDLTSTTLETRMSFAFQSDKVVLQKHSAVFKDDLSKTGKRNHTWGWKKFGKIRDLEQTRLDNAKNALIRQYTAMGYKLEGSE